MTSMACALVEGCATDHCPVTEYRDWTVVDKILDDGVRVDVALVDRSKLMLRCIRFIFSIPFRRPRDRSSSYFLPLITRLGISRYIIVSLSGLAFHINPAHLSVECGSNLFQSIS